MEYIETLLCAKGKSELLELHLQRLTWGLYQNGYPVSDILIVTARNTILNALPQDENYYRIRYLLNIDFNGVCSDRVEVIPIEKPVFSTFSLGIYTEQCKQVASPWNAKTTERDLYRSAAKWAAQNNYDDAIILNEKGHVIETTIFNICIMKENKLFTPPLSDMPVKGVYRTWMMHHSVFPVIEKSLTKEDLFNAEAILLTNAVRGIQLGRMLE